MREYDQPLGFYERFPDQPRMGGSIPSAGFCPIVYQQRSCITGQHSDMAIDQVNGIMSSRAVGRSDVSSAGTEYFGPDAGCFRGSISRSEGKDQPAILPRRSLPPLCLQFTCNRTVSSQDGRSRVPVLSISIGGTWLDCPPDQSEHIFHSVELPDGLFGSVACPRHGYDILCMYQPPATSDSAPVHPPGSGAFPQDQEYAESSGAPLRSISTWNYWLPLLLLKAYWLLSTNVASIILMSLRSEGCRNCI